MKVSCAVDVLKTLIIRQKTLIIVQPHFPKFRMKEMGFWPYQFKNDSTNYDRININRQLL